MDSLLLHLSFLADQRYPFPQCDLGWCNDTLDNSDQCIESGGFQICYASMGGTFEGLNEGNTSLVQFVLKLKAN